MNRADYTVVKTQPGMVWIVDNNSGGKSVTNDAEQVCKDLDRNYRGCRIIYKDSDGNWDELLHCLGRFEGFRAARHLNPEVA